MLNSLPQPTSLTVYLSAGWLLSAATQTHLSEVDDMCRVCADSFPKATDLLSPTSAGSPASSRRVGACMCVWVRACVCQWQSTDNQHQPHSLWNTHLQLDSMFGQNPNIPATELTQDCQSMWHRTHLRMHEHTHKQTHSKLSLPQRMVPAHREDESPDEASLGRMLAPSLKSEAFKRTEQRGFYWTRAGKIHRISVMVEGETSRYKPEQL